MPRKTLSGRYYVPKGVCEDCAKFRRRSRPNPTVQLSDNLVVSSNVRKRLKNKAALEHPKTLIHELPGILTFLVVVASVILGMVYASSDIPKPPNLAWGWVVTLAWIGSTVGLIVAVQYLMSGPPQKRDRAIEQLTIKLAQERAETYEDRQRFYSSPEWRTLREQVIREEGQVCGNCGRRIRREVDLTVDHIRPRSRFPDLALARDNLRALCRRCNSRKVDRLD